MDCLRVDIVLLCCAMNTAPVTPQPKSLAERLVELKELLLEREAALTELTEALERSDVERLEYKEALEALQERALKELEAVRKESEARLDELRRNETRLVADAARRDESLQSLQEQLSQFHEELSRREDDHRAAAARLEQLSKMLAERESDLAALHKEVEESKSEQTAAQDRMEELQQKYAEREQIVSRALSENAAKFQQVKRELFEREAELTRARTELEELANHAKADLEHQRQAYENQIKEDRQAAAQKIQALHRQILDLQREKENSLRERDDRDAALKHLQNSLDDSHRSASRELAARDEKIKSLEERSARDLAARDQKIQALEERLLRERSDSERKIGTLTQAAAERDEALRKIRDESDALHKELAEHQWAIGDAHTHLEEARKKERDLTEQIESLTKDLASTREEARRESDALSRELISRDQEIATLKDDHKRALEGLLQSAAEEIESARRKHEAELQELREAHDQQLQEERMAASVEAGAHKELAARLRLEVDELRERMKDPSGVVERLEQDLLHERSERAALEGKLSVREDLLSRARLELQAYEDVEKELQRMRQRVAELEKNNRSS